jgi:asparagine synthase (glutamine-hydrolysing)
MCGIAGYISSKAFAADTLAEMTRRLAHRGPDAEGLFSRGQAHLGHRRLCVIDIAGSAQPMSSADDALTVVFNGEIYNFRALRQELADLGWRFRSSGDTEVLLAGWRAWGPRVVDHLQGMFAFALWDARDGTLFAARDHLGVKPFHYAWNGETFVFGSEIKALLAHPAVAREIDVRALRLYLECQFVPAPHTIFTGIRKLPPGHALHLKGGKLEIRGFWRPDYADKLDIDDDDATHALDGALRSSVAGMLIADVPVGAFVSGGVDSALIAALMTDIRGGPIDTFNIGFEGDVPSEHREAAAVARHIGSRHHAVMLSADDVLDAFDHWIDIFDEPFADQAALPTMLLAAYARQHVTVALTGEGADEVFGGYANYRNREREERYVRWLAHPASPLPALVRLLPTRARKDRLLRAIAEPLPRRYRTIPNVFDSLTQPSLLTPSLIEASRAGPDLGVFAAQAYDECNSDEYVDRLLHIDMRLWLPDDLLTKVDRATMAHALEARVPYLDHRLVEFCARLRANLKIRGRTHKFLLKRVAARYLPAAVVERGKQGFVMPLSEWLTGRLAGELETHLLGDGLARRGIFRASELHRLLREHRSGRRRHAGRLWALLILERWFRRHAPEWRMVA